MTASANEYTFHRAPYRHTKFSQIDETIKLSHSACLVSLALPVISV